MDKILCNAGARIRFAFFQSNKQTGAVEQHNGAIAQIAIEGSKKWSIFTSLQKFGLPRNTICFSAMICQKSNDF